MNCPVCNNASLVMSERSGIEIDYCPTCRGVWLDRGELDKLIERAAALVPSAATSPGRYDSEAKVYSHAPHRAYSQQPASSHHDGGYYKKKKREGFLGELFDFD